MRKWLSWALFASKVVLNTALAVFGTAVITHTVAKLIPPQSISDVVVREWASSLVGAAILGWLVKKTPLGDTARWAFAFPLGIFLIRIVFLSRYGEFTEHFLHLLGYRCDLEVNLCRDFIAFTLPLLRGCAYSAASRLALTKS